MASELAEVTVYDVWAIQARFTALNGETEVHNGAAL